MAAQPSSKPQILQFLLHGQQHSFLPFNFTLTVSKSDPHHSLNVEANKSRSVKAKLLGIIRKFRFGGTKKEAAASPAANGIIVDVAFQPARFWANREKFDAYKEPKCMGSIIVGSIGLLSRSISRKDQNRITLYSLIILLFLAVASIFAMGHLRITLKNSENIILYYFGHH